MPKPTFYAVIRSRNISCGAFEQLESIKRSCRYQWVLNHGRSLLLKFFLRLVYFIYLRSRISLLEDLFPIGAFIPLANRINSCDLPTMFLRSTPQELIFFLPR